MLMERPAWRRNDAMINVADNPIRSAALTYMLMLCVILLAHWVWDVFVPNAPSVLQHILIQTAWPAATALLITAWRLSRRGLKPPLTLAPYGQGVTIIIMFGIWAISYFVVKMGVDLNAVRTFHFVIEDRIPFVPGWAYVYMGLYPLFFIPLLLVRDDLMFKKVVLSYLSIMTLVQSVFIIYPVGIIRPELHVTDFATWILQITYRADNPAINCFPSMHVAMVLMAGLAIWEVHRAWGTVALIYAVCIATSTVLTKQHYVVDSVASMAAVTVVYFAFYKFDLLERATAYGREWWQRYGDRLQMR